MPSDEQIIQEAVRLVNEGLEVTMLVKGSSMLPFILGGLDSVALTKPGKVHEGDVVLARIGGSRYVLHRVMEVTPDRVELMGDGNIRGREICRPEDLLARAVAVVGTDGHRRQLDTPGAMRKARLWRKLLPIRRWILAVYRRTYLRNKHIQ